MRPDRSRYPGPEPRILWLAEHFARSILEVTALLALLFSVPGSPRQAEVLCAARSGGREAPYCRVCDHVTNRRFQSNLHADS